MIIFLDFLDTISSPCSSHSDLWLKINESKVCQVSGGSLEKISSVSFVSLALLSFKWLLQPAAAFNVQLPRCRAVTAQTIQLCIGKGKRVGAAWSGGFHRHPKTWTPEQQHCLRAFGQQDFKSLFFFFHCRFVNQYDLVSARDETYVQGCVEANNSLVLVCRGMMPSLILLWQPLASHMFPSISRVGNRPFNISCVFPFSAPWTVSMCFSLNFLVGNWMDVV